VTVGGSYFHSFRPLKKYLDHKRFSTDADVKQVVTSCLETLDINLFYAWIQLLVPQWGKCLNVNDDYVEPGVYHLLPKCRVCFGVRIKFSVSESLFLS